MKYRYRILIEAVSWKVFSLVMSFLMVLYIGGAEIATLFIALSIVPSIFGFMLHRWLFMKVWARNKK